MVEEKNTGLERLLDESIAFRMLERTLQLKLEDTCVELVEWAVKLDDMTPSTDQTMTRLLAEVTPILIELRELRGNATGAAEEPPLFIGGTMSPIRDEGPPRGPIDAAREHLFRAHFDGPGDGDELREDVVGALEAYHRELWAQLARKGMI